tara:strand:+ start:127 stop:408 length:282 start_codon:yes stop_codon:yes gene_type:complete
VSEDARSDNQKVKDLAVDLSVLETCSSLDSAMGLAGGTPKSMTQLKAMTAFELIALMAPNGVRFTYVSSAGYDAYEHRAQTYIETKEKLDNLY